MKKRILVDVDITICESDKWWYQWLLSRYPLKSPVLGEEQLPYNLTELFHISDGETGLEFWEDIYLYDDKQPRKDARKYIKRLSEVGHEIMFVSHVSYGNHAASKLRFLEGWFPYHIGTVFTHQKYVVQGDVLIDDSVYQCKTYKQFNPNSQVIKYRDDYKESLKIGLNDTISTKYSWEDIYNAIMES